MIQDSSSGTDAALHRAPSVGSAGCDDVASRRPQNPSRAARWLEDLGSGATSGCAIPSDPTTSLPDVQASTDQRGVRIDRVGISALRHPLTIAVGDGTFRPTVGTFRMTVALAAERKGTHMSRFLEVLSERASGLSPAGMIVLAQAVRERLDAPEAQIDVAFAYFIGKPAPVTGLVGLMDYEVTLRCRVTENDQELEMELAASGTSLCPCSKLISAYGAHNQRCRIVAAVRTAGDLSIEELAQIVESAASAEVYSVLKRPDEKFVTERAYERPKFVEDIIRDLAIALDCDRRVTRYRISSENFESIHSHNAYAEIVRDKIE